MLIYFYRNTYLWELCIQEEEGYTAVKTLLYYYSSVLNAHFDLHSSVSFNDRKSTIIKCVGRYSYVQISNNYKVLTLQLSAYTNICHYQCTFPLV